MKKLKEKIVDFRKRHAKGLDKLNKGLNWFLIVIITFIVGLFLVGTIKGCSDSLKNNSANTSDKLDPSSNSVKSAHAVASNYEYFTFNSQLLPSNQSWSNSAQLFSLSKTGFGNYTKVSISNFASDKSLQSPLALIKPSDAIYYSDDYRYYFGVQLFTINVDVNTKLMSVTQSNDLGGTLTFNMSVRSGSTSPVEVLSNRPQFYQFTRDRDYIQSIQSITFKFTKIPSQEFFLGFYALAIPLESIGPTLIDDMFDVLNAITLAELNSALYCNQKYVFSGSSNDYDYGYNTGYGSGYNDGTSDGFTSGYNDGFDDGTKSGYTSGYNKGYSDGSNVDQKNTLQGLFLTAFQSPFHLFQQMFDVNVLGINLGSLLASLIVLLVCAFVIKRLI